MNRYGNKGAPVHVRFWDKVTKTDTCWLWQAAKTPAGYGQVGHRGRMVMAHRIAWMLTYGPIPAGAFICHHCDTPACVRPDHLFLGSAKANSADMIRKGRGRPLINRPGKNAGASHGMSKLTDSQVLEIRRLRAAGLTQAAVAKRFGISQPTVCAIVHRHRWRHL